MKKYTFAQHKKYYDTLPKKRISAGVLFFNHKKELLIVKPSYKDNWILVGGTVDKNESPEQAARREVKEETSLSIGKLRLLDIEYKKFDTYRNEALYFLFYGGRLSARQIARIKLPKNELTEFRFVSVNLAKKLLSKTAGNKLDGCLKAIKNQKIIYRENGRQLN